MSTTNLGLTYLSANQYQKEVTFNADLDLIDGDFGLLPVKLVFTVGAKTGATINVTAQLQNAAGVNLSERLSLTAWLSDASPGGLTSTAPSGGWAAGGSSVKINDYVASAMGEWMTDGAGLVTISITMSVSHTYYLHLKALGKVWISPAISF